MKRIAILFCLAGILLSCSEKESLVTIAVTNSSSFDRHYEMVEIPWDSICLKLMLANNQKIIVLDSADQQIPYQIITEGTAENLKLIFLADVGARDRAIYRVKKGEPQAFAPMVYGRFVPERKDDFAWENNRVAFRVYGPALEATGEISNGMDFWLKGPIRRLSTNGIKTISQVLLLITRITAKGWICIKWAEHLDWV